MKKIFIFLTFIVGSVVFANDDMTAMSTDAINAEADINADVEIEHNRDRCGYIQGARRCDYTRGCYWNNRYHQCMSDSGSSYPGEMCYDIHSPRYCDHNPYCRWSYSRDTCVPRRH